MTLKFKVPGRMDGLVQERRNSSALANLMCDMSHHLVKHELQKYWMTLNMLKVKVHLFEYQRWTVGTN